MRCWVGVVDHPLFAVTGDDGTFELKGVPPGTYTVGCWTEAYGVKELPREARCEAGGRPELEFVPSVWVASRSLARSRGRGDASGLRPASGTAPARRSLRRHLTPRPPARPHSRDDRVVAARRLEVQPHRDDDHRDADVLEAPLDQERRLVVEDVGPDRVGLEDELPRDDEPARVVLAELRRRASRPRRGPRCRRRRRSSREGRGSPRSGRSSSRLSFVRSMSASTSSSPLNAPVSTTAMLTKTTPLKCPGNIRRHVSSAWRPSPP